jgi:hypothetical protein
MLSTAENVKIPPRAKRRSRALQISPKLRNHQAFTPQGVTALQPKFIHPECTIKAKK